MPTRIGVAAPTSRTKAGMAAGFLNTLRLGSEAVAVALYGSVLTTLTASRSYDSAFHLALWGLAAICLVLGLVVFALMGGRGAAEAGADPREGPGQGDLGHGR